mgnify:CR=1 FL=1
MSHSAETVRTFPQLLSELEDGAFAAELTGQMAKLVAELRERASLGSGQASGKLALTLSFSLNGNSLDTRAAVTITPPAPMPRPRSVLFLGDGGDISRSNPRQPGLFRDVNRSGDSGEARTV